MKKDLYNLSVTTESAKAIDAINHFHTELLKVGKGAGKILDAAKEHEDCFLIHCYAAAVLLYAQDDKVNKNAIKYLDKADKLFRDVSEREQLIYQAIKAWYSIDYELALTLFNDLTRQWPSDCTSAKMAEWVYYCTGQAYNAKPFLKMCESMHEHCKKNPGFLATHSFALELCGKYEEAMDMALKALEIDPGTPWAHHTVGHTTLNCSQIEKGIALYEKYAPVWEDILPLLRGHLYWHYALYYVANRDEKGANTQYAGKMQGVNADALLEHLDVISYLWRMEMAGMPQDEKLIELVSHIGHQPYEFYMPFDNAHYMYALSRIGRQKEAERMLDVVQQHAEKLHGNDKKLWHDITLPLLRGIKAFAEENYKTAAMHFEPIIPYITQIGGSDAQDEMFYEAYLVSLLKSGQGKKGQKILNEQLKHYKPTALGEYWNSLT